MDLRDRNIIILINNKGVHFNPSLYISWEATNFPDKNSFHFNERVPIYWIATMEKFDKDQSQLFLNVVDYTPFDSNAFQQQQPKSIIKSIFFEPLIWEELQAFLAYYKPNVFEKIIIKEETIALPSPLELPRAEDLIDIDDFEDKYAIENINFKIPINKVTFKMGFIEFERTFKGLEDPIKVIVSNEHIIPEFNYIKAFFAKAIGRKSINISGRIEVIQSRDEIKAYWHSPEIALIDESLISSVKRLRMKAAIKNPKILAIDKSLFTPQDFFDGFTEEQLGNRVPNRPSNEAILEEILSMKGVRNRKQLAYLAGKLQTVSQGLKFTLSPQFGFLFYVAGEEMDHFIWELLNTNATYLWSIDKATLSMAEKYKRLERKINYIKDHGRLSYLRNETAEDFIFNKINHKNASSKLIDGFPMWKAKLNEQLI